MIFRWMQENQYLLFYKSSPLFFPRKALSLCEHQKDPKFDSLSAILSAIYFWLRKKSLPGICIYLCFQWLQILYTLCKMAPFTDQGLRWDLYRNLNALVCRRARVCVCVCTQSENLTEAWVLCLVGLRAMFRNWSKLSDFSGIETSVLNDHPGTFICILSVYCQNKVHKWPVHHFSYHINKI